MMCTTAARSDNKETYVQERTKFIPQQVTQTYTSSLILMKKLTTIAFSTILYMKKIFTEENFRSESFENIPLHILSNNNCEKLAQLASKALENSFDALEKKYLDKLALLLYEGAPHPDHLTETYALSFTYKPAGVSLGARGATASLTMQDEHASTKHFLQACVAMMNNQSERDATHVVIRLYYNDAAPAEYQAPGYSAGGGEDAEGGVLELLGPALADTHTRHHALALHAAAGRDLAAGASAEANASTNIPTFTEDEIEDKCTVVRMRIECECGREDRADDMLTCRQCDTMQHAACYGVRRGSPPPPDHLCQRCVCAAEGAKPAASSHTRSVCIARRVFAWCSEHARASARALRDAFALSDTEASKLMRLLARERVLPAAAGIQRIDHIQLNTLIDKHFRPEENVVVERIVAESQGQGAADPVQEALRPSEMSRLRKGAGVGELVPHWAPERVLDSSLERYRGAALFADDGAADELPLSGTHNPVPRVERGHTARAQRKAADADKQLANTRATKKTKLSLAHKSKK